MAQGRALQPQAENPSQAQGDSGAPAQPAPPVDPATDPSFDAALPPLDSIAAPPAEPPASATAAAPAPTGPSAAAAAPAAAPAAATPVPDAALTAPLTPLAQFNPEPNPNAAKTPSSEPDRIRYTTRVEGLDKVGLTKEFRSHSTLIKEGDKAANTAQVTMRAKADVTMAETLMRSEGYYDGVASYTVTPVPNEAGRVVATISATPGARFTFSSITISQAPPVPATIARQALPLEVGQPIQAAPVIAGEANVALVLPEQGYPFAKVGQRDILLDGDTHTGAYTLPVDAGPLASFGGLETKGDEVFSLKHLSIFPRFKPGQQYDSRQTEDLRQALVATGLFSLLTVEPVDTGRKAADGTEIVDLMVDQQKGRWRTISGEAGYGTGQGIKATATWTNLNRFPPEGALIGSVTGGTLEQGASVTFRRSDAGERDRTFQTGLSFDRSNYDAYQANTLDLLATWSRRSTPIWQKIWTYSYGAEIVGTSEKGAATTLTGARPRRQYLIGAIPLEIEYDRSNSLLNPTKGFRLLARVSPEASLHGNVRPYVRTTGQATGYFPISKSLVIAGRALVSSIFGASLFDIAPSRRVYAGGGGSVRGYGYQQLGPKDVQGNPIGGLSSTEFAIEARYRFGNYGIVPFFDGGRVGTTSTPSLSGMRYGVGIGGRYYTNFGPIRIDVATPIDRQKGESRFTVYISIGQAF